MEFESRSLSDSEMQLAEKEIEEQIAKKQKRPSKRSRTMPRGQETANDGNKRDSRTGEAIGSKMCRENPERCTVR